jgi:hypothetical protein
MSMSRSIVHEISFSQGSGSHERSIVFKLSDSNRASAWIVQSSLEGSWRQSASDPAGIDLYPNFSMEDKKRLLWRWDRFQHGGLIQVGIDTPTETNQGRTAKSYFRPWFSFRGAKRFVSGQFRVAGALGTRGRDDYTDGKGVALYELPGSSNTFQQGEGQWSVYRYEWRDDDDAYVVGE